MGGSHWSGVPKAKGLIGSWVLEGFPRRVKHSYPKPHPAPGQGLGACEPLKGEAGGWNWALTQKGFAVRPHLACLCFPFFSGKYINFLGKGI